MGKWPTQHVFLGCEPHYVPHPGYGRANYSPREQSSKWLLTPSVDGQMVKWKRPVVGVHVRVGDSCNK